MRGILFWRFQAALSITAIELLTLICAESVSSQQKPPGYTFLVFDLRGVPPCGLTTENERSSAFYNVVRDGISLVNVETENKAPLVLLKDFLEGGEVSTVEAACEEFSSEKVRFLSTSAGEVSKLAGTAHFFAPDLRHRPFRSLAEKFGLPKPLDSSDLSQIEAFRNEYGPRLKPEERVLAEVLSGIQRPSDSDIVICERFLRLIRNRKASFAVSVITSPTGHGEKQFQEASSRIQHFLARTGTLLREKPYRDNSLFGYVSLFARPKKAKPPDKEKKSGNWAFILGTGFKKGMVVRERASLKQVKAALFKVIGLCKVETHIKIPEGILESYSSEEKKFRTKEAK